MSQSPCLHRHFIHLKFRHNLILYKVVVLLINFQVFIIWNINRYINILVRDRPFNLKGVWGCMGYFGEKKILSANLMAKILCL